MHTHRKEPSLFNTVPAHNYLGILKEGNLKKVVDYLELTKKDVANATKMPPTSIRYDEKMPKELVQRLQEIAVVCELVAEYFKGDLQKTTLWFQMSNPLLGNISPRDMIRIGRYQKLVKFIHNALEEEAP